MQEVCLPSLERGLRILMKFQVFREFEGLDHPFCKASTFEDLVLGLVIIHIHHIDGKNLLEIDDLGILLVDLEGGRCPVNGPHRTGGHGCSDEDAEKKSEEGPT